VPDPLADLRETEPVETLPVIVGATGSLLPPTDDGKPMEYLYQAETLEEAVALALMVVTPETMDAIAHELLVHITGPGAAAPLPVGAMPLVTSQDQDEARDRMIAVWHTDTVCQNFVHKGGVCGCRYLATQALAVVMPAAPDPEPVTDLHDDPEA
jgi:hypothetical protein